MLNLVVRRFYALWYYDTDAESLLHQVEFGV